MPYILQRMPTRSPATLTEQSNTVFPYERYVDGLLQVSEDGINWFEYNGNTITIPSNIDLSTYTTRTDLTGTDFLRIIDLAIEASMKKLQKQLSPFQEWEKTINDK